MKSKSLQKCLQKNQFCIYYRKNGAEHKLFLRQAMIKGEPILSITGVKFSFCRQRFLRRCPLYFSNSVSNINRAKKEGKISDFNFALYKKSKEDCIDEKE